MDWRLIYQLPISILGGVLIWLGILFSMCVPILAWLRYKGNKPQSLKSWLAQGWLFLVMVLFPIALMILGVIYLIKIDPF